MNSLQAKITMEHDTQQKLSELIQKVYKSKPTQKGYRWNLVQAKRNLKKMIEIQNKMLRLYYKLDDAIEHKLRTS